MALYLGIDGGGTKTAVAVGDETRVLATTDSAGSNIVRVGEESTRAALIHAVQRACSKAGADPRHIMRTCMGVAGASVYADKLKGMLYEIVSGEVNVVGDNVIALHAAFGTGPGVIVIAGTGSICFGRNDKGSTARAGGWGHAISDEGSGHWIGRRACGEVVRAIFETEEPCPVLLSKLRAALGFSHVSELVRIANSQPAPNFAELMPLVVDSDHDGDRIAHRVLEDAGRELASLAHGVLVRLWGAELADDPDVKQLARVAGTGGVFRHSDTVRTEFMFQLHRYAPWAIVQEEVIDPVMGALELARANGQ
jgi:N-acetylglucosamine kinase-like BadF-type ATPase